MYGDVQTVNGTLFYDYGKKACVNENGITFEQAHNRQTDILATIESPFDVTGGLKQVAGNLGKAMIKVSAVPKNNLSIKAPAMVFTDQLHVISAYQKRMLQKDHVLVLKGQGPKSNGMPELHKLMPVLANLQDDGFKVALLTDGRLSGASGKVLSAIHLVPEAANGGAISKIHNGDIIEINAQNGTLNIENVNLDQRESVYTSPNNMGVGREIFSLFTKNVTPADEGAISIDWLE